MACVYLPMSVSLLASLPYAYRRVCISTCLPAYVRLYASWPVSLSICLYVYLSAYIRLYASLPVCLSACIRMYASLSVSVCLSTYIRLYASLSVCMSTCLLANVRMCTCQSSCLSSYLTERLFACLSYRVYVCLHTTTLSSLTHSLIFGFLLIPCVGSPPR